MQRIRRANNYTLFRHVTEQLIIRVSGTGAMASFAHARGWQGAVQVERYALTIPCSHPEHPPLRIAFASDFHAGPTTHPQAIAAACDALRAAQPDVLLLGGDFVSLEAHHIDPLAELLAAIPAPFGRFVVLGNHDLWADDYPIVRRLEAVGIRVLVNANAQLAPPYDHVWICGLDDPGSGTPDAPRTFRDAHGVRVLLMHAPEGLRVLGSQHFDLALCGHTHGGQIAFPNGRPVLPLPGRYNRLFSRGRFQYGVLPHSTLIVSRGVGYGGLPVRCFADPDVIVCTLNWRSTPIS